MSIGREYKILITGTMGAGKSTAIKAISDIAPVTTDVSNSDLAAANKLTTTVALDYGVINLDGNDRVHIYGTPGQERFDYMLKILAKGVLGTIILIDNHSPTPLADLERFLSAFDELAQAQAIVIGITHQDLPSPIVMADYSKILSNRNLILPVFSIDARNREHILLLLDALISSIEL